ncbi:MAG: pentapeptide repeat-containing protein [Cyanobacteriota bacterium ELA615]|jgi:hypothetical protein
MKEIENYHQLLGLEWGATIEEINQAYRDLVFIWHPDRLPRDNTRLLDKATAKIQQINQARQGLLSWQGKRDSASQQKPENNHKQEQPCDRVNWVGLDLRKRDLSGYNLSLANLSYADLRDSFLPKANLKRANLLGANLNGANLLQANLEEANLEKANLISADLSGANLRGANLENTQIISGKRLMVKLTGALLDGAILPQEIRHFQKAKP